VVSPAIVLLAVGSHLDILLAKDHEQIAERDFLFHASRRIRLPHAWRARAAELASRVIRVRIEEETLFNDLVITGFGKAFIPDENPPRRELLDFPRGMLRLRQLTGQEYHRLARLRGRELRRQVMRMFYNVPGVLPAPSPRPLRLLKRLVLVHH
jgi:hypothetical protein